MRESSRAREAFKNKEWLRERGGDVQCARGEEALGSPETQGTPRPLTLQQPPTLDLDRRPNLASISLMLRVVGLRVWNEE